MLAPAGLLLPPLPALRRPADHRRLGFQWACQLGFDRDSWTAPVDAARLHPLDDTDQQAASQVRALAARLPAGGTVPLFVFDAGYDSAQLTLDLAGLPAAVLVRLRSDRCFYHDPPPRPPGARGRPRRHGAKFAFADPTTWPAPTATLVCHDDQYGTVTVQAWAGLHPKQHRHPGHGSGGPRPIVGGTILRVQVQRVPARTRPPKVLWLWWAGPAGCKLDLDLAWWAYIRRFDLEHRPLRQAAACLDHPAAPHARPGRAVDLAGAGRLHPAAPGPPGRLRPAAAVGAAPTPAATVTLPGAARVFATVVRTRLAGECAETRRALPGSPQGPLLGTCRAVPGDQEASDEAQEEGHQAHQEADQGRLTRPSRHQRPPTKTAASPPRPKA